MKTFVRVLFILISCYACFEIFGQKEFCYSKKHEQSIPTLEGDEMEKKKEYKGILTRVKRVSGDCHRVHCGVREKGGKFFPTTYLLPETPLLLPKLGMLISFQAYAADSLSREQLTIGGVRLND